MYGDWLPCPHADPSIKVGNVTGSLCKLTPGLLHCVCHGHKVGTVRVDAEGHIVWEATVNNRKQTHTFVAVVVSGSTERTVLLDEMAPLSTGPTFTVRGRGVDANHQFTFYVAEMMQRAARHEEVLPAR